MLQNSVTMAPSGQLLAVKPQLIQIPIPPLIETNTQVQSPFKLVKNFNVRKLASGCVFPI